MFKEFFKGLSGSNVNHHDPKLNPGEVAPGVFQIAGEQINFINKTHNGKPMSDSDYEVLKDIFKPHID